MRELILIRPEPGASASLEAAQRRGIPAQAFPLFSVEPVSWQVPDDPDMFDGLLIGSANAFRHGGERLNALRKLPVYAVGPTTAEAAEKAGFSLAMVGQGGLQSVLNSLGRKPIRLLRLAGEERIALDPPKHVTIAEAVLYQVSALPITEQLAAALSQECVVACHSAQAASHFRSECIRLGVDKSAITIIALGPRIADAAGDGWRAVHVASAPNDRALLECVSSVLSS